jgi:hypothetical protein
MNLFSSNEINVGNFTLKEKEDPKVKNTMEKRFSFVAVIQIISNKF